MAKKAPPRVRVGYEAENEMMVISTLLRVAIPLILMFGFYIQFHGEVSPGGGFQSGIIFAVAFILRDIVMTIEDGRAFGGVSDRFVSSDVARVFAASGVLIYAFAGIVCSLLGYSLFDYSALALSTRLGGTIGLTVIEIGVASTVFGAMVLIYNSLVSQMLGRFFEIDQCEADVGQK